ncbi:MAG: aminotransferase class I/II-fold pyridoxal phosphate-dependent enzyme [Candidatus Dadabacteria bacterium]|nr:MAG: aminotransferase class I/II-fold pyridoxal phosphate-dependent enzyme [Candidatus Dadabacteria bacterium]
MTDSTLDSSGPGTRAVHGGRDRHYWKQSLTPPLSQSSTFRFDTVDQLLAQRRGELDFPEYARYGNPTIDVAQQRLAAVCGAEASLLTASGMAAQALCVLALCGQGARVVLTPDHYRGTSVMLGQLAPRYGIEVVVARSERAEDVAEAVGSERCALIFTEFPTNPHLRAPDLRALAQIARDARGLLLVDATLSSPLLSRPLEHGADLVVYSATKYLSGHNDVLAGAIAGPASLIAPLNELLGALGCNCAPLEAWLVERGLRTLDLRFRRQSATAAELAQRLSAHPGVAEIWYPEPAPERGLPAEGRGGVVSFRPHGGSDVARRILDALRLFAHSASFGGCESMAQIPALLVGDPDDPGSVPGLEADLIRLSVGLEDVDDLWTDLEQALECST